MTSNVRNLIPFGKSETEAEVSKHIDLIDIQVSSSSTTVVVEDRKDIKAELSGKGDVSVKKSGDTIHVKYNRQWYDGFNFLNQTPKLKIYIPEDYEKSMAIDVGSGYLNFRGSSIKLDELNVHVGSGKVDLRDIEAKEYTHNGSSGMIEINGLLTEKGSVKMSSGIVKIRDYQGALDAEVSSGQLDIQMDKIVDDINLEASSGHIKLDLPDHADFTLKGNYSSGYIDNDFPLTDKVVEKNKVEGVSGSGKHNITIKLSSGIAKIY
nr:DUF4097 family beta strand repeat-containing protein [Cytobacillus eiseniae]